MKKRIFTGSEAAVSEIVAQLLMTTMVVIALSGIGTVVFTHNGPEEVPTPDIQEWASVFSDTIYLRHCGGDPIDFRDLWIRANVNGVQYECSPEEVYLSQGKGRWDLGDVVRINTRNVWGIDLKRNDSLVVYLIDIPSGQLIQKFSLSTFGPPEWITPQGAVRDTSPGGSATIEDVQGENDGLYTTYYPPSTSNPDIYEEFVFDIDSDEYGLTWGDSISNVTLKILYQGHDNNYGSIKMEYWNESSQSLQEYEENLPEYNDYDYAILDLSSYINTFEDLKNLKIRFYAAKNAASDKAINIDYIAIKIS